MTRLRRLAAPLIAFGVLAFAGSAHALPILDQLLGGGPGAEAVAPTNVTTSSARLNGRVHPNGHGTKWFFEYGTTIAYGGHTDEVSAGGSGSWKNVSATVSGLEPGTTYHFRVVADNSRGTTRSDDLSFTTAGAPDPGGDPDPGSGEDPGSGDDPGSDPGSGTPGSDDNRDLNPGGEPGEPRLGHSFVVAPGDGELLVRRPGHKGFVPLDLGSELPVGTEIDAAAGTIALTSALPSGGKLQTGRFGGGRFMIRQGKRGYVDLYLRGRACTRSGKRSDPGRSVASAARRAGPAAGSGAATAADASAPTDATATPPCAARAGWWRTRCAGTLTRVTRGCRGRARQGAREDASCSRPASATSRARAD